MKKKLLLVLGATMIIGCLTACGSKTDEQVDTTVEETTEVEGVGDVIEDSEFTVFDNDVFSFKYDPDYFVVSESETSVIVSFSNEDVQTAGSNTIEIKTVEGADAMDVAKEFAKVYGASEDSISEVNLAYGDVKAYSVSSPVDAAEGESQIRSAVYAVVNGDNVITIEVLAHIEEDEGIAMTIDDKIAEVLDTFSID